MGDSRYVLKPLSNDDPKRGYRLEIDEFIADNEMTNLFLIALSEVQKNGLKDWTTYYSLAGIHGSPREEWNGYQNDNNVGYCKHGDTNFPTWHRPYMMFYESVIHEEMVNQANLYSNQNDKQIYLDAAARFRLPFWDPIMPRNKRNGDPTTIWGCPEILKARDVFVKLPKGDPSKAVNGFWKISNPLYSYSFPGAQDAQNFPKRSSRLQQLKSGLSSSGFNPDKTVRNPTRKSGGESDTARTDLAIQRQAANFATTLWVMLNPKESTQISRGGSKVDVLVNEERSWDTFANHDIESERIRGVDIATVSVESFHDGVHGMVGQGEGPYRGVMGNPRFASFDPIFWLHHNNVERLFCLYQALYPEKFVSDENAQVPLTPFMNGNGRDVYKASDPLVKGYWNSGFAVPGVKKPDPKDRNAIKDLVQEYLTKTYYWATEKPPVPRTLSSWPKTDNNSASWALAGSQAVTVAAPVLHLNAISKLEGVPKLVAREVTLEQVPAVQDRVIETSKIIQAVQAADGHLPDGAVSSADNPVQMTWNAHITARKFAFDGTYSIHLFLGHVKDDQPERFLTKKNEVGFTTVFASPPNSDCAACVKKQHDDFHVADLTPLTTILYDYLESRPGSGELIRDGTKRTIRSLDPEEVVPFLKEQLQWRMIDLGANLLAGQEQAADLQIKVTSREFTQPTAENPMGTYGPFVTYPEITNTKPGGFGFTA